MPLGLPPALPQSSSLPVGVAPPPSGGSGTTPGPASRSRTLLKDAASKLLEAISESPELAKALNPVIESLITVMRQSVRPPDLAAGGSPEPPLDRTPTGPESSGASPLGMLAHL